MELLKDALLDLHYLDNELRIAYLTHLDPAARPDPQVLRDPIRHLEVPYKRLLRGRIAGRSADSLWGSSFAPYTDGGRPALDHLEAAVSEVEAHGVVGDVAECGVGRGGVGIFLRACLETYGASGRDLWMIDPFLASDPEAPTDVPSSRTRLWSDLNQVREGFDRFGLLDDRVRFLQGRYAAALADDPIGPLALLRIGLDAALSLDVVLSALLPRVSVGGVVMVEGVGRSEVEERLTTRARGAGLRGRLERIDWNTVVWTVEHPPVAGPTRPPVAATDRHRVPVPLTRSGERLDLTVVVVFYNMAREAARTLLTLSRSYQQGLEGVTYEVIAVDNGSDPEQRLDAGDVQSYGPEFRLVTFEDARPSPTAALNHGIAESRGHAVALMIDGAHALSPGVFRHSLAAMTMYEPAVVAVQHWYVGPGQQGDSQQAGYNQTAEDALFRRIRWPQDGYRLFEIGHFIGDRDWFDGIPESNCLFAPRWLLEQVGGFDDSFAMPGGGYANLELFERLHAHPGVNVVTLLGEATFHQFHGGTTTNVADDADRRARIVSYGDHFHRVRGRGLSRLTKPIHYVGSFDSAAARRTRSRYAFRQAFDAFRDPVATTDGQPRPVAEELKSATIDALWHHQAWRQATWLGHLVSRLPTDLHSYQELMAGQRADVVVIIGDDVGLGGRARFAASVADELDHGRVIAVGRAGDGERPAHPRITYVDGSAEDRAVTALVVDEVADGTALLLIGLGARERVCAAFAAFAPLVPVGGYVVVENTVLNGRPVAPGFGPGPHEAVNAILREHPNFVADVAFERYTVTFNKGGYLRRVAEP